MSNRLTQTAKAETPVWNVVAFWWLAALTVALVALHWPSEPPVIPDEAHALYRRLPSPRWTAALQALAMVWMFLASGALLRHLLPEKTSAGARSAAGVFGTLLPAILLYAYIPDALGPQPLFPAWTLALLGALALFTVPPSLYRPLLGFCGVGSGLALSLDASTLPVVIPTAGWVLVKSLRTPKAAAVDPLLWCLGLAAGLAPIFLGLAPFATGLVPSEGLPGLPEIPGLLLNTFTWWSVPFALLGLLAAAVQLRLVLLGWMLPVWVLQILMASNRPDLLSDTQFFVRLPGAWLIAYGAFRLVKGVEQGVRSLNPKKAKPVLPLASGALLTACTAWAVFLFLNP